LTKFVSFQEISNNILLIVTQIDPRGLMGIVEQRACNLKMEGPLNSKIQNRNKSALIKLHFIFPAGYLNE